MCHNTTSFGGSAGDYRTPGATTTMAGRHRIFASPAARQAAYRLRVNTQLRDTLNAWLATRYGNDVYCTLAPSSNLLAIYLRTWENPDQHMYLGGPRFAHRLYRILTLEHRLPRDPRHS